MGNKIIGVALAIVGGLVYLTALVLLGGLLFQHLWAWFVVPVVAVPALSLAQAIGLKIAVDYTTFTYVPSNKDEAAWNQMVRPFVFMLVTWLAALVVKAFL